MTVENRAMQSHADSSVSRLSLPVHVIASSHCPTRFCIYLHSYVYTGTVACFRCSVICN